MDKVIKIEEFELDVYMGREDFEYKDTMQLGEEVHVKTELAESIFCTDIDIKNEIDTGTLTFQDRIKCENIDIEKHDRSDSPPFPNGLVKIEKVESEMYVDRNTLGHMGAIQPSVQLDEELNIKNESGTNMDASHLAFDRISEHSIGKWNETVSSTLDIVDKIDIDTSTLHTELDIEDDIDTNTCDKPWANIMQKTIPRKVHQVVDSEAGGDSYICYYCEYTVGSKNHLISHMKVHEKHPETAFDYLSTCSHCNASFKSEVVLEDHIIRKHPSFISSVARKIHECINCNAAFRSKLTLDEHIIKKHPNCVASVSSKPHECTYCTFKTTILRNLRSHLLKHPETTANFKLSTCVNCNAAFRSKLTLDEHIIKKHPNFVASVSSKLYECTYCTFKTAILRNLRSHLLKHPETAANYLSTCSHSNASFKSQVALEDHIIKKHPSFISSVTRKIHECINCNAAFRSKLSLDEHIIKKHPNFVASVSSKLHECTYCTFKTTILRNLRSHLLKHPETTANFKLSTCVNCNAAFRSKLTLDEHIIKKHPNFIASVSSKIHECTKCTFKTTTMRNFHWHLLKHSEIDASFEFSTCIHCNRAFRSKAILDDHIIKKHPNFIASVSSKIHECTKCTFKTTILRNLRRHLLKHPETAANYKFSTCKNCNAIFKSKRALDNHIIKKHTNFVA